MDKVKDSIKTFLINKDDYSRHDLHIDIHKDIYINSNKFSKYAEINDKDIDKDHKKIFNDKEYISLLNARNIYLIKQTDVRKFKVCDFLQVFGLIEIIEHNNYKLLLIQNNIKLSKQYVFTYTIYKFFQENYPDYSFQVEYELLKKLGKIQVSATKGPRLDICIEELQLAIEFDESQHDEFDNMDLDINREQIIIACGYNIIRCSQKQDITSFISNKLIPLIDELELVSEEDKIEERIINDLVKRNLGTADQIKKLVSEQILDIKEKKNNKNIQIGQQIRNMTLDQHIFSWLQIPEDSLERNEIYYILESIDEPYRKNDDEILLSPDAFVEILGYLDGNKYPKVLLLRKCVNKVKDRLLEYTINSNLKIKQIKNHQKDAIPLLIDYHYMRGKKDSSSEIKRYENEINKLKKNQEFIETYLNSVYPNLSTKEKTKIIQSNNELNIGDIILDEIPELIYTGNYNDNISINEIETMLSHKARQCKNIRSNSKCIAFIKNKLNQINVSEIYANKIFQCNWNWLIKKNEIETLLSHKNTIDISNKESDNSEDLDLESESDNDEF